MKCKVIAFFLCIVFVCTLCLPVYADSDSSSNDGYSAIISDIPKVCPTCSSALHAFWFSTAGAEVELSISDEGKVTIPAGAGVFATINLKCKSCGYEKAETRLFGLDWGNEKPGQWEVKEAPTGIGRKDLPGYADDNGTPSISSDGGIIWQPTWDDVISLNQSGYYYSYFVFGFASAYNSTFYYSEKPGYTYFEGNIAYDKEKLNYAEKIEHGLYLHRESDNLLFVNGPYFNSSFVFQLPVRGSAYRLKTPSAYYKQLDYNFYYTTNTYNTSTAVTSQILLNSGMGSSVTAKRHDLYVYFPTFKIIPASDSDKPIIQNNITINNNTWNGNIYTDNSTNLTYIYPQYITINEKNETVTNISNTPIIYNNETKQYYTYDQTTKNYYYITYNATPTPSPSPTPDPTDKPGGSISTPETGKPGGSSGSSWWDKLLDKIGDAIIDGLLGAVSAVLKLIFKLLSTILGWIIWAVSLVFTLFPFLPPGLSGLLVGGVVVCFVIGIIKFIRG